MADINLPFRDFVENLKREEQRPTALNDIKNFLSFMPQGEVYKTVTADPQLMPVSQYIDIFVAVAQLVTDTNIGIANKAVLITSHLQFEAYPKILEEMLIALDYDNSAKCNAYEVVINIASKNSDYLNLCNQHGYIDHMLSELKSDDILFKLNILELLSRLVVTPHGISYLVEHGVLQMISESISNLKNDPLGNILTPGYMKFFGAIAHMYPREIFKNYPVLLDSLFEILESREQSVLPVALDTLGFVGSTVEGKLSLAALGSKYTSAVNKVCELIRNSASDIKIRALFCMTSLISTEKDPTWPKSKPIDHRITLMTREWFRCLSEKPESMEALYGICKNPFPDIKLAGLNLLDAVCEYSWGQELVARTPGFIEYLLDRSVDYTKECKEAKYEFMKRLCQSTSFDTSTILKLTQYVEQGPFFTETIMQVAMEEGD
ncbi:26S proteasome non-ATPase regulatory subunit 5 [Eumeta japonica]|uniref:26S proteasome non-ATPase regulatory subunit 5 n=1 Tax=Eumeta variegata TaxID=151549 RepID=A0A4C1WC26_EUMVA|nr:26S proteasome non-ATPase regulatory subunit 5 [Eumeta japonica]